MKRLLIYGAAILILLLSVSACSQTDDNNETDSEPVAAAPTAAQADGVFDEATATGEEADSITLHQPVVMVMTNTPPPATPTPEATATEEPTAVPPTSTPAPVQPTNPPPPPPTAVPPTEPPPPPPPPAMGANGLVATHFAVQDRSEFKPNGKVWFDFTISNSTGSEVPYYSLGVMPKKNGADRVDWYQQSYKGQNSTISAAGFSWEDNIRLPEGGDYTLRVVMCFDSYETCTTRSGTYVTMSQEIPITIVK